MKEVDNEQYYDKNFEPVKEWGKEDIDNGVTELHAVWTDKKFPVDLVNDDGVTYETVKVAYGDCFKELDINKPAKEGYEFDGFYSERNGGGIQFFDADLNPTDATYTDLSINTLYANWTPIRYTVGLLPNGGAGGVEEVLMDYATMNVYLNGNSVKYVAAPVREHYIFAGYYSGEIKYFRAEKEDGKLVAVCDHEWDFAANVNLKAKWTPINYTITYVDYNGTEKPKKTTINADDFIEGEYTTEELHGVAYGVKATWKQTINMSDLGDISIEPTLTTTIAALWECYDPDTDTYQIWYPSQLDEMRQMTTTSFQIVTGNFELMRDINLNSYNNWTPIPALMGGFNGNSHVVSGMKIQVSASGDYGLFSNNLGNIIKLTVKGEITIAKGVQDVYVGLLCGTNTGRIERCYTEKGSSYSINSSSTSAFIGGLVGYNKGTIFNVANRAGIYGKGNIGGIVGKNEGTATTSFISLASSQGEIYAQVEGTESIGGIVAIMTGGRIESCTCVGNITIFGASANGNFAAPCAGVVIGTFHQNSATSYGTQFVNTSIAKEGKMIALNVGGDIGKTIIDPNLKG